MRKNRFVALILALVLLVSLVGCGAGTTESTEPTQNVQGTAGTESTQAAEIPSVSWNSWPYGNESWQPVYDQIQVNLAAETGGTIELIYEGQAYGDTINTLLTRAAASDGPDIAMVNNSWVPQLHELGCLVDLTDYIPQEAKDDCYPGVLDAYTIDGELVAFPYFVQPLALFYNKDLLEAAGVTELPTTMAELYEAAEKVAALGTSASGQKIYGLGLANSGTEAKEGYNVLPMMWANGGDITDADGNVVLNSEENIETFTLIQRFYQEGISPNGMSTQEMRNLFGAGLLGFYWDLQSQVDTFCGVSEYGADFVNHIGAMPVPENVGYSESIVFVVLDTCENLEAAGTVVAHLSGVDTLTALDTYGKTKMSSRASVMNSVFANVSDEITAAFVEATSVNMELPCVAYPAFELASQEMLNALIAIAGGSDVREELNDLNDAVTELYQ